MYKSYTRSIKRISFKNKCKRFMELVNFNLSDGLLIKCNVDCDGNSIFYFDLYLNDFFVVKDFHLRNKTKQIIADCGIKIFGEEPVFINSKTFKFYTT